MRVNIPRQSLSLRRIWHTACYLQPRQILYQIWRRLFPPSLKKQVELPNMVQPINLMPMIEKPQKYLGGGRFLFLNREEDLGSEIDWRAPGLQRLWQYNLHYFDYLNQPNLDYDTGLALITKWIKNHTPESTAVGWEPYPSSLRLINWFFFLSKWKNAVPTDIIASLLLQAVNLQNQIEYHIGGNHLWANAKALWYAGTFLGKDKLAAYGRRLIIKEINEQFLPDGGHFELSPMYHALLTEDLLDLINLCRHGATTKYNQDLMILKKIANRTLGWLKAIVDDTGQIPLLNDAAYGIAASYEELSNYALRLGITADLGGIPAFTLGKWQGENLSGYLVLKNGPFRLLWDTASLGPDHLMGHAHCDMLSVLLDFQGMKILTDTGVSQYAEGQQRRYERSTAAHNTVVLDGLDQAEMWKSFRVGRRGHPKGLARNGHNLWCSHDGFEIWQPGLRHERRVNLLDNGFELTDFVFGPGQHRYEGFFHFAPTAEIEPLSGADYLINQRLLLKSWGAAANLVTSHYSPEFGKVSARPCLILQGEFRDQHAFGVQFIAQSN